MSVSSLVVLVEASSICKFKTFQVSPLDFFFNVRWSWSDAEVMQSYRAY